ncbi:MAG: universal stress protein [Candidatus Acidiferrum sp.]|jgi:nucleotide-binding universal stress UspA family protein
MQTTSTSARIQIKNVLFATDFSPAADAAIPYVREIATRYGANLVTLHVRPPVLMTPPGSWTSTVEGTAIEEQTQREGLRLAFSDLRPTVLFEDGDIHAGIAAAVENHKIDMIVAGTRGRSGVEKFFLGSTAEEIFRHAFCPVLTVGPNSRIAPARTGLREILYATDFNRGLSEAASYAVSLAQEFQARLTLIHVIPERKAGELVSAAQLEAGCRELLHKLVPPDAEAWCEPEFVIERGEVAEKILTAAKDRKADLIVLGVHPETGFPGAATHLPIATAHKVVSHAICPVLTVRDK